MEEVLQNLMRALRGSGVRISVSETMDALEAVKLVGYGKRQVLREALGATLAKSQYEKKLFETCFNRYFSRDSLSDEEEAPSPPPEVEYDSEDADLSQMLLSGDNAGLSMAMRAAARQVEITGIWFFTQKSLYVHRILEAMGLEGLEGDIKRLSQGMTAHSQEKAGVLREARDRLAEHVRDFVEQQYTLFAGAATEEMMEKYLRNMRLSNLEERDFHRMRLIIQKMVKRLNDIYSRRKKRSRRGLLDVKRTIRQNLTYDGLLFEPQWKCKKVDRPDIMVLCDVSRSVQAVARFMLLFLYSLNEAVARISSFIFCSNLVEVSHVFDGYEVEEVLVRLQRGIGLGVQLGRTDYGQAFQDFKEQGLDRVGNKTTVIILGDARNNYGDPETGILRLIYERSRRLIWLNPEPSSFWGTGDSEMAAYRAHCSLARECSTVNHLERVVDFLLKTGGY